MKYLTTDTSDNELLHEEGTYVVELVVERAYFHHA